MPLECILRAVEAAEKAAFLKVLREGDAELWARAQVFVLDASPCAT